MRTFGLAVLVGTSLALVPAFAQQPSQTNQAIKVPQAHEAFVAEYGQLLKKYPDARRTFMLMYGPTGRRDIQVRCNPSCDWHPDVGLCTCGPDHGQHQK